MRFYVAEEIADLQRCSVRKIHELTRRDLIPYRVLPHGRRLLFEEEHLRQWAEGCELERVDLPAGGRIVRPKGSAAA